MKQTTESGCTCNNPILAKAVEDNTRFSGTFNISFTFPKDGPFRMSFEGKGTDMVDFPLTHYEGKEAIRNLEATTYALQEILALAKLTIIF